MSNKLPWFTHDHDAHDDGWIRNLVRKQGHVAGWLWWVLLELHHKHGVGDVLKRDLGDVARAGLTSASVVVRVLTEMGTEFEGQTKVRFNIVGTELKLEIKKLRERQSKLKSKIPATLREHSANTPIEREEEGEREEEREERITPPASGLEKVEPQAKPTTPLQRVVHAYKEAKGVGLEDKAWDKANFSRYAKAAASLLECFRGSWEKAAVYVIGKGREFDEKGLDWTLETIKKHAWDNRGKLNGTSQEAVGDNALPEPGRRRYSASGRIEISGAKEILGTGNFAALGRYDESKPDEAFLDGPEDEFR